MSVTKDEVIDLIDAYNKIYVIQLDVQNQIEKKLKKMNDFVEQIEKIPIDKIESNYEIIASNIDRYKNQLQPLIPFLDGKIPEIIAISDKSKKTLIELDNVINNIYKAINKARLGHSLENLARNTDLKKSAIAYLKKSTEQTDLSEEELNKMPLEEVIKLLPVKIQTLLEQKYGGNKKTKKRRYKKRSLTMRKKKM